MHWAARGAILRGDVLTYVYLSFLHYKIEEAYAIHLVLIVRNGSQLAELSKLLIACICRVAAPFRFTQCFD